MVAQWTGRSRPARTSSVSAPSAGAATGAASASTSVGEGELAMDTSAPPPFLNKTYDMVNDSSTDSIVSWGENGNSFVVWNSTDFAEKLLPRHFKHSNFSSFVRQLNTYGFRKVDPDRWEFANEGFLKGKKHLLKNIHRRKPVPHPPPVQQQQPAAPQRPVEVGNYGIEGEIERLKRDKNVLMAELVRLRQQQQQTDRNVQMLMQRVHLTEQRQQQMVSFLAKAMQSPSFLSQLVQQNESKKRLGTAARKKRRLPKDDEADSAPAEETSPTHSEGQIVKYQPNANDPVTMFLQLMNSPDFSSAPKIDMSNLEFSIRDLEHSLHRSRMVEDLPASTGIIKDLTDSFSAESPTEQQNQAADHQMQLGSLLKFENAEDMEQGGEEDNRTDGELSSSLPLDEGLSDLPEDEAFWKQMFDATTDNQEEFDGDALNAMESLTLLPP